ncbi:hypothetical protein GCM10009096_23380 [Parasphingorhabdus litoris]|uniref:Flagellar assembly protein FliH/Type III secretion system HrpE domain-containing protein n=1 Tax=Parasphingorhabdus litoris TaxID=394733 RepID=A0ABP3KM82_9SPHN|nr:hypothetical protein [Parasphingorhabdus litoris]
MAYTLFHSADKALFADSPIIKQDDAKNISTAVDMLAEAEQIKQSCAADRAAAVEQGYAEGRAAALQEMRDLVAAAIVPLATKIADNQAMHQKDLAALAFGAVEHILGAIADDDKMTAITKRALSNVDMDDVESIALSPDLAEAVQSGLAENAARLVKADPGLQTHDCVIRTRSGAVLCGLDLQLETLGTRWGLSDKTEQDEQA